ncbi:response regulator [Oculatella sp. LEGE 06141]|uniref:response regulator transcription factor n=1 Tax=Oculatella sp. LEGE 06141 TaxID=1828648 RepID=UPI00187DFE93|nr:response regulator [Oculatella sp. LEGE 06141]MBE9177932.1 response regulator [Oculatella sp. LEGE 06141]
MEENETSRYKLLLIDDDFNLVMLTKDYLEYKGYEVITAENGVQGIEAVLREKPDLIICDVMMPEMNGYTFVGKVREDPETQGIPVLFLSAKGQSKDRIDGLKVGADVYMVKPFEPDELVAQVEALLHR